MAWDVTPGNPVRLTVFCVYGAQVGINVFHYITQMGSEESAPAQEVADLIVPEIQVQYAGVLSNKAAFAGIKLEKIQPGPPLQPVYSSEYEDGAIAGDPLPSQCSGITSWRTAFAGKRYRGRTYWPFPAEADNNVDEIPSAAYDLAAATLSTKMQQFTVTHPVAGEIIFELNLWSKMNNSFYPVESFVVREKWATQRRRGQFGRPNQLPF